MDVRKLHQHTIAEPDGATLQILENPALRLSSKRDELHDFTEVTQDRLVGFLQLRVTQCWLPLTSRRGTFSLGSRPDPIIGAFPSGFSSVPERRTTKNPQHWKTRRSPAHPYVRFIPSSSLHSTELQPIRSRLRQPPPSSFPRNATARAQKPRKRRGFCRHRLLCFVNSHNNLRSPAGGLARERRQRADHRSSRPAHPRKRDRRAPYCTPADRSPLRQTPPQAVRIHRQTSPSVGFFP